MNHINIPNSYKEFANKKAEEVCYETGHKNVKCNYVLDEFDPIHPLSVTLVDYAGGRKGSDVAINVSSNEIQISDIALKKLDYIYYGLLWIFILYKSGKQNLVLSSGDIDSLAFQECYNDGKNLNDIEQGCSMMFIREPNQQKLLRQENMLLLMKKLTGDKAHFLESYELPDGKIIDENTLIKAYTKNNDKVKYKTFEDFIKLVGAKKMSKNPKSPAASVRGNTIIAPSPEEKNLEECPDCKVQLRVHPAYNTKHTLFCPQCGNIYKGKVKI